MPDSAIIILELAGIGAFAGVLGGLFGIGGGLIMIPIMVFLLREPFGPGSFHVYKLAAITASFVLAVPAAIRHARARAVVPRMLPPMAVFSVLGILLGVTLASQFGGERTAALRRLFGVFLILIVGFQVFQHLRVGKAGVWIASVCPTSDRWLRIGSVVGFPAGLIAGLLGVGGGIWAVPSQALLFGVAIRNAIANSTCLILVIASVTAAAQGLSVAAMPDLRALDGFRLGLGLAPGALIGGWLGAGLTHRFPVRRLRQWLQALLALAGAWLMAG